MLKVQPVFFLLCVVKEEMKGKLREELLTKGRETLDDLRNSQPSQIAKDAKIRRFTVGKMCPKKRKSQG